MSEKIFKYEGEEKEPGLGEIQVADLRHTRELAEPPEAPAAAPSEPAPPEKQAAPAPAVEPPADVEVETEVGMHEAAAATAEHGAHDHHAGEHEGHAHEGQGEEGAASAFEMEQLRLLFGGGLTAYLRGQLGLLFNFALISLGRMPNPATGIVAIDLDKAKTAIDVFEFLITRIQAELQPTERTETMNLIAELKYLFMQQAQAAAPQAPVMPGPV